LPETPPTLPQRTVEPLTQKNIAGGNYEREHDVEEQIISTTALSDEEIIARAKITDKEAAGFLQEETLVYLIRFSFQQQRRVLYNALSETLIIRCQEQLDFRLRSLDADLADEAYAEIMRILFGKILSIGGQGDFLQVRFWFALDRIAIDVFRQYSRRQTKDRANLIPTSFTEPNETDEAEEDWEDKFLSSDHLIPGENRWSSVERQALIEEALLSIEEPIRTAFVLHYYEGWKIESIDPEEITLSTYFRVTPKTIGNWLRKADFELKNWRGDHHE
jgi:DNA-directed RNA polymerase specialized sigma24 family protein